jgi:hypothetical protein
MFLVHLNRSCDVRYQPLTVDASEYLYGFAAFIARTLPDTQVYAHLGSQTGDEVVFRSSDVAVDDVELF